MHPSGRTLTLVALGCLTLASVLLAIPADASSARLWHVGQRPKTEQTAPACVLNSDVNGQYCYFPSHIQQAEATTRFRPINPTGVVANVSGLPLFRVMVDPIAGPNQSTIPGGQIMYVYGTLPPHLVAPHLFAPTKPRFVIVTEIMGHGNYPDQITMSRGYVKKWHAYAPWHFVVVGPIPGVALEVQSNLTQQKVREIGMRIVTVSRLRKHASLQLLPQCLVLNNSHRQFFTAMVTGLQAHEMVRFGIDPNTLGLLGSRVANANGVIVNRIVAPGNGEYRVSVFRGVIKSNLVPGPGNRYVAATSHMTVVKPGGVCAARIRTSHADR